jgi:hypothetical protein
MKAGIIYKNEAQPGVVDHLEATDRLASGGITDVAF